MHATVGPLVALAPRPPLSVSDTTRGGHRSSSPASILIGKVAQVGDENVPKLTQ